MKLNNQLQFLTAITKLMEHLIKFTIISQLVFFFQT